MSNDAKIVIRERRNENKERWPAITDKPNLHLSGDAAVLFNAVI